MVESGCNSKQVGDETEAKVLTTLISNGFSVSVPFGDNDKYDLIVDNEGALYRIQCKTAWRTKTGTIRFNTHSQTTEDGEYRESTYDGEVDAFIVRYPQTDNLYWIDAEETPEQKMELRFSADIDHPSINWAEDYEFDGRIPR
jgi:hypothetical protein